MSLLNSIAQEAEKIESITQRQRELNDFKTKLHQDVINKIEVETLVKFDNDIGPAIAMNNSNDVVGMKGVIAILHLLRDLIVGLRHDLLDRYFIQRVSKTPEGINIGHKTFSHGDG